MVARTRKTPYPILSMQTVARLTLTRGTEDMLASESNLGLVRRI